MPLPVGVARGFALLGLIAAVSCSDTPPASIGEPDGSGRELARCGVTLQVWALENEPLRVPLECESGEVFPRDRVAWKGLPDGAEIDRDRRELRWTPALDQAGNHTVKLRFAGGERGEIRIGVADRFEDPENVPIAEPTQYTHEFGLPVFHLTVGPEINANGHTPATVIYEGREIHGASAKHRGSTSLAYPKKSFTLKFDEDAPFVDEARGFPNARRIVLTTTFDDASGLRQRLSFELWNRLERTHLPVRHFNAVVYLDGRYQGLYEATDHIDDDYLRAVGIRDGANLYKARQHAANFRLVDEDGKPKRSLRTGYTKEAGFPEDGAEGAYADLEALVEWIATAPSEVFFDGWETRLARRDFEDWLIFTHLIAAGDTTNKNCYLIHDPAPEAADPRWRFVPWDFNASFGQGHTTHRLSPDTFDIDGQAKRNALFERILRDPRLREPMLERYREVLNGPWSREELLAALDRWAHEIEAAALRDELRWGDEFRSYFTNSKRTEFNTHREEIQYLSDWITKRWAAAEENL